MLLQCRDKETNGIVRVLGRMVYIEIGLKEEEEAEEETPDEKNVLLEATALVDGI